MSGNVCDYNTKKYAEIIRQNQENQSVNGCSWPMIPFTIFLQRKLMLRRMLGFCVAHMTSAWRGHQICLSSHFYTLAALWRRRVRSSTNIFRVPRIVFSPSAHQSWDMNSDLTTCPTASRQCLEWNRDNYGPPEMIHYRSCNY